MTRGNGIHIDYQPGPSLCSIESRPPPMLYHYTSREGLFGIVESRTIWATNLFFLNDGVELSLALRIAKEYLASLGGTVQDEDESRLVRYLKEGTGHIQDQAVVFVFSVSELEDSLSQWRAYAPDAGFDGYSLGFPGIALHDLARTQDFLLNKCIYDRGKQESIIAELIDHFIVKFREVRSNAGVGATNELYEGVLTRYMAALAQIGPMLKHESFADEREWRLISIAYRKANAPTPNFRRSPTGTLIPYLEIAWNANDELHKGLSVKVGPTSGKENSNDQSVIDLFRAQGCNEGNISRTESPYRRL